MEVDPALYVASSTFSGIQEHRGELGAEVEVVGAAAPLPPVAGPSACPGEGARLAAAG